MIYGIGLDTVEVTRIQESIERTPVFKDRVFSPKEIAYCETVSESAKYQRFAARFAAKEAFLKACGTGLREGYKLNEITVTNDALGKPAILLEGLSQKTFNKAISGKIHLSLTHTETNALAMVLIEL
ncbi:MAG: holo-ACP synthase [Fibrobacteres bacterium]|nr:holo-ACP synthase [Fibrobacterota bacterium]